MPTTIRAKCGATRPQKAIVPTAAILTDASSVAKTIRARRVLFTGCPSRVAKSSPSTRTSSCFIL